MARGAPEVDMGDQSRAALVRDPRLLRAGGPALVGRLLGRRSIWGSDAPLVPRARVRELRRDPLAAGPRRGRRGRQPVDGLDALHGAAINGSIPVAAVLLDAGARVDACDARQRTALHFAAAYGNKAMVRFLLDRGHPLDTPDHAGANAEDVARVSAAAVSNAEEAANFLAEVRAAGGWRKYTLAPRVRLLALHKALPALQKARRATVASVPGARGHLRVRRAPQGTRLEGPLVLAQRPRPSVPGPSPPTHALGQPARRTSARLCLSPSAARHSGPLLLASILEAGIARKVACMPPDERARACAASANSSVTTCCFGVARTTKDAGRSRARILASRRCAAAFDGSAASAAPTYAAKGWCDASDNLLETAAAASALITSSAPSAAAPGTGRAAAVPSASVSLYGCGRGTRTPRPGRRPPSARSFH